MKIKIEPIHVKIGLSVILAIIVAISIISFFSIKRTPHVFFYKDQNPVIQGKVKLDSEPLGDLSEKGYVIMPETACSSQHTVYLTTDKMTYEFSFYPVDCKYRKLIYEISESHEVKQTRPDKVTFLFVDDRGISLAGKLYYDDRFQKRTQGTEEVSRDQCTSIKKIVLATDTVNVSWSNEVAKCQQSDEIRFSSQDLT